MNKHFIWLGSRDFPDRQQSYHTIFSDNRDYPYTVVAFRKNHSFPEEISELNINIFADNKYFLYINDTFCGLGPTLPGGDYGMKTSMPVEYYNTYTLYNMGKTLKFYVMTELLPNVMCDVSAGRGGLCIEYDITFKNGKKISLYTDNTWECRLENQFKDEQSIDFTLPPSEWKAAEQIESVWSLKKSPILNLEEKKIEPESITYTDKNTVKVTFDKIYSGYICLELTANGIFDIELEPYEFGIKRYRKYKIKGSDYIDFRFIRMESVGEIDIFGVDKTEIKNIYIISSHYPIPLEGSFNCSDNLLNLIYSVGKHTTDICRQTIELDSPMHQENLGCTGDYFIESLIAYYCFGDYSLSRFDILRTAEYMRTTGMKMFHTSYSLIWVNMLYDYYMYSGDKSLLYDTSDVLEGLMELFDSYVGKNGVLETAPNYMFIDWVEIDSYSLHHPPKALGQAALTAFYYNALVIASKIQDFLGDKEKSKTIEIRAEKLKYAFNKAFYNKQKGLYISGLNTPSEENEFLPKNSEKIYFTRYPNVLAALYGLCDNGKDLMERVMTDTQMPDIQPYFMHFVLEAIYKCGLFDKYGLREIHRWDTLVQECPKGLKEAWGDECQGYGYDYSHAWGATPTYQLPSKLSGLKILGAGFKKISLSPNFYGLEYADISIPSPFGLIKIKGRNGSFDVSVPDEIEVI